MGSVSQAEIFTSYGETTRALQAMKHSGISFFGPAAGSSSDGGTGRCWFPQPVLERAGGEFAEEWAGSFLVASLIRQESEFNAGVVTMRNAYGLMQLLPSVGKAMAKKDESRDSARTCF